MSACRHRLEKQPQGKHLKLLRVERLKESMGVQPQDRKLPGFEVDSELVIQANEFARKIDLNTALTPEDKEILPSALACLPDQSLIGMLNWDNDRYGLFGVPGETLFGSSGSTGMAMDCAYVCKDFDSAHLILYNESNALVFVSGQTKWELVGIIKTLGTETSMSTLIESPGVQRTLEEAFQYCINTGEDDKEHVSDYWKQYDDANSSDGEQEQDHWPKPDKGEPSPQIRDTVLQDHLINTVQTSFELVSDLTSIDPLAFVLAVQQLLPVEIRPSLPVPEPVKTDFEPLQPSLQRFLEKSLRGQLKLMSLSGCDYMAIKKMLEVALIHCIP